MVARNGFPDGGVTRIESYGSDPVGGQLLVSACGLGRASASGALWRMAVGAAVPLVAGRVAASVFQGNGRMFKAQGGGCHKWRRILNSGGRIGHGAGIEGCRAPAEAGSGAAGRAVAAGHTTILPAAEHRDLEADFAVAGGNGAGITVVAALGRAGCAIIGASLLSGGAVLILNEITAAVSSQLDQQSALGVQITTVNDVPETGPASRGLWFQIPQVTAVFADLKGSTALNATDGPKDAAFAYTYFTRAMSVILDGFGSKYTDVQGDGIFGLFSGKGSMFKAAACAVTMRTLTEQEVAVRYADDASSSWKLTAGIGIDHGTLLVRRLGLRGTKANEVWAGKAVNTASKLSSLAGPNQVVVSERVFAQYQGASKLRQRALLWSCGCNGRSNRGGLAVAAGQTSHLWDRMTVPRDMGLDFAQAYRLKSAWCPDHGAQLCEAIVTGRWPS